MKVHSVSHVGQALAKALKKPVLFLAFPTDVDNFMHVKNAAPYLDMDDNETSQAVLDGHAFIVCENEEELNRLYDLTIGDDGPTKANAYDGPIRIYALTIDKNGVLRNENT